MKKLALFILLVLATCYYLLATPHSFAANENFSTSANTTYTVNGSGMTHVVFAETLTNNTDKYYASSYKIHLGFQDIENVKASDTGGAITPQVDKTADGEDVSLAFNSHVFGKNKSLPFTISFDTKDVASLNGSIWEVNIPGLSNANDFANFTVHVVVPSYFGNPTYKKPTIGDNTLTYTKDQLGKSGISLAFGDKQVYAFHLTYNLKNSQLFPISTEVALPADTSYQHIELDAISPRPTNVTIDSDGNWLAQFSLKPSQTLKVTAAGKAYVSLTPSSETLTQNQVALYTKQQQYWEVNNAQIKQLAKQLKTPEAIYDYVVKTLHYDFARVSDTQERLGAVKVLQHPDEAVCLEFTDLFITLARAAGIPARELDGYGYTQNTTQRPLSLQKEVLHAWPEYYDSTQKTWVMVDPTWENTTGGVDYFHTFDFDHLTLVTKGVNSSYPIPAGGYKLPGQEGEKDVLVSFAKDSVTSQPVAQATLHSNAEFTAGLPITASVVVRNTGTVLFPNQNILATALGVSQNDATQPIPPFGSITVPLNFGKTKFLTNKADIITIQFAGKTIAKNIHITAFSTPVIIVSGGISLAILSFIISIIARRSRRIPVSQ